MSEEVALLRIIIEALEAKVSEQADVIDALINYVNRLNSTIHDVYDQAMKNKKSHSSWDPGFREYICKHQPFFQMPNEIVEDSVITYRRKSTAEICTRKPDCLCDECFKLQ